MGAERMFTTGAETEALMTTVVRRLACRLKKFTSTDDGKIALSIELEATDEDTLKQLRSLLEVQQGQIEIDVAGIQGQLDL
jgi:hypothetical protein